MVDHNLIEVDESHIVFQRGGYCSEQSAGIQCGRFVSASYPSSSTVRTLTKNLSEEPKMGILAKVSLRVKFLC